MKNAIIYTRYSPRPNAGECDSCDKQKARCRKYCDNAGFILPVTWKDEAVSGGILERYGLSRAIHQLQPGWVLVVDRPDRLSRDLFDTLLIRRQVEAKGATIEFADGSPSGAGSPEEIFFANVMAALAAYERDRIVHRCKVGKKKSRKEGKFCGGRLKIGWMMDPKNPGKVIRCEIERKAIIHACLASRCGRTSEEIAEKLNNCCIPCRGERWSARTVRKIIARESFWVEPSGDMPLEPTHP